MADSAGDVAAVPAPGPQPPVSAEEGWLWSQLYVNLGSVIHTATCLRQGTPDSAKKAELEKMIEDLEKAYRVAGRRHMQYVLQDPDWPVSEARAAARGCRAAPYAADGSAAASGSAASPSS